MRNLSVVAKKLLRSALTYTSYYDKCNRNRLLRLSTLDTWKQRRIHTIQDGHPPPMEPNVCTNTLERTASTAVDDGHTPVMKEEILTHLDIQPNQLFVDMTFGGGGISTAILEQSDSSRVVCLDRDPEAYSIAEEVKNKYGSERVMPCLGTFSQLPSLLQKHNISPDTVDGVVFDVGSSSMQFDQSERGFSISKDGPLDMRMNASDSSQATAADVVNGLGEEDLTMILKKYGEEKMARNIAHAIVEARSAFGKITRTQQLADIISSIFEDKFRSDKLHRKTHVATKTFQALRIFVNNELNELHNGMEVTYHYLRPGGHCVALTFHSLEDRIIKRHFHEIDMDERFCMSVRDQKYKNISIDKVKELTQKRWTVSTKRIITPSAEEIEKNPRSRSAKLRSAVKTVLMYGSD